MSKPILSSDQKHNLRHTFYEPNQDPLATLLIVHGMAEHSGRYINFAQYLADHGITVLTYDLLGHGGSINKVEDLGFFTTDYPVQTLLKDVELMANQLQKRHPNVPHFIMGHSMGSFIVRNFLQTHSQEFAGAIIMGTGDYDPLIAPLMPIAKILNKYQPKRANKIFATATNKLMGLKLKNNKNPSQFAWIAKNEDSVKDYEADPLTGFDFTNNGFWTLFNLMQNALNKDWAETIDTNFPMLFVSGKEDPVGNNGKGIQKITKRLRKQGFSNIQSHLYPGMRHEPLHEKNNQQVYSDIFNWIQSKVS